MNIMRYTKNWKMLSLVHVGSLPKSLVEWRNFIWGFDIWLGPIPALKSMIVANLIMWVLMWTAKP